MKEKIFELIKTNLKNPKFYIGLLLAKINYEYVYTPDKFDETLFEIRDAKDYPVLYTAIFEDVDIFVT